MTAFLFGPFVIIIALILVILHNIQSVSCLSSSLSSTTINSSNNDTRRKRSVSIVTGSRGYLGRQIVHELIDHTRSYDDSNNDQHQLNEILCLVREKNVIGEQQYWDEVLTSHATSSNVNCEMKLKVMPYDMLDGGKTLSQALDHTFNNNNNDDVQCCVYHVASIFTPTENHYDMALHNVKGTVDLMNAIVQKTTTSKIQSSIRVVLTSSTAAVRGPANQKPINGKWYTHKDWNTSSEHGKNWGNSYQWSKAESERKAWDIANKHNIPMVSICPSFIFGPPRDDTSSSYSLELINSWITGDKPVQSRLCVDIRDVAKAHRLAGTLDKAIGERLIVSSEARISSEKATEEFQRVAKINGFDYEKIHPDTQFDGGTVKIGKFTLYSYWL